MKLAGLGWVLVAALAAGASAVCGCAPCPETIVPLARLVAEHNANATAVPKLWALARIEATLYEKDSGLSFAWPAWGLPANPNGRLFLAKGQDKLGPHDFLLVGRQAGADVFRLGSSTEEGAYYFWYNYGDRGRAWWGQQALAGAPGVHGSPINPNDLLAVLGVCELPDDFTQPPTVALTMNTTPGKCAYVVTYIDRQPVTNRLLFRREMHVAWSNTGPRRPFLVNLFDNAGVRVMTARLRDYRPIDTGRADGPRPVMPTDIRITWPRAGTKVHIVLSGVTTTKGRRQACLMNKYLPSGLPVIQVDRHIRSKGAGR